MAFIPASHSDLRIGLYIKIEGSWFSHPFPTNTFKIRYQKEIDTLRGLKHVKLFYDPDRSDPERSSDSIPGEAGLQDAGSSAEGQSSEVRRGGSQATESSTDDSDSTDDLGSQAETADSAVDDLVQRKRDLHEGFKEYQSRLVRVEAEYKEVLRQGKAVVHEIGTKQAQGLRAATRLVESITRLISDPESSSALMNLMGTMEGQQDFFVHALNVCALSLLIGKDFRLKPRDLDKLALGALFHDIGELKYSMETLLKKAPSSVTESNALLRRHPKYGREMLTGFPQFPIEALDIIAQHHERLDGSGYPLGLKGDTISPLAKIVMVADEYDELCNPPDPAKSLIPSEALSYLYAKRRKALCKEAIVALIRLLGVYPPGTIVVLSNETFGLVTSVNVQARLRPIVMVYSEDIPREEAMIVDLAQESELSIIQAIRPAELPSEVRDYLNPRRVISSVPLVSPAESRAEPDALATVT